MILFRLIICILVEFSFFYFRLWQLERDRKSQLATYECLYVNRVTTEVGHTPAAGEVNRCLEHLIFTNFLNEKNIYGVKNTVAAQTIQSCICGD